MSIVCHIFLTYLNAIPALEDVCHIFLSMCDTFLDTFLWNTPTNSQGCVTHSWVTHLWDDTHTFLCESRIEYMSIGGDVSLYLPIFTHLWDDTHTFLWVWVFECACKCVFLSLPLSIYPAIHIATHTPTAPIHASLRPPSLSMGGDKGKCACVSVCVCLQDTGVCEYS